MILRHPNVITYIDEFESDNNFYLVLQHMQSSLSQYLNSHGPLSEASVKWIFKKIVSGAEYCHSRRLIHGDLKLDNIVVNLDQNNRVTELRICDFGISCSESMLLTTTSGVYGTVNYIAPEMLVPDSKYEASIDVWSLGVILHELLTGGKPYEGSDLGSYFRELQKNLNFNANRYQDFSLAVIALLMKLLAKDAKDRPAMDEIKEHPWLR